MVQMVSIFTDDGRQYVFQGRLVQELTLWEGTSSSVELLVSIFRREAAESRAETKSRFVARVIAKNLGHPQSGVCHSASRASLAPRECQLALEGATFEKVLNSLFKKYPKAEPVWERA
ncbi:hypothetical protein [Devosia sp.]|uniref:hypothetical protein n=1 Tax=Devosia sp. TaxID=1871048 RepID=UPI002734B92C|nr:hypothetical protein [Devosia sp.]MDP2779785.1 hypothetical protein [Devosia sp.]